MRLKVLSLFLLTQIASFTIWQSVNANPENKNLKPVSNTQTEITKETNTNNNYNFDQIRFSAKNNKNKDNSNMNYENKTLIISVLSKLPKEHIESLKKIIIDYNKDIGRGLGGKQLIILRGVNMDKKEEVAVLLHEIGHVVDLGMLKGTNNAKNSNFKDGKNYVKSDDLSIEFYKISWLNETTRTNKASNLDFVSGYAMTDPFEDFAESYVYYVLHNKDFLNKAKYNKSLMKKYNFIKEKIFYGKIFNTGETKLLNNNKRPWDITVLNYNLDKYLTI